MKRVYINKPQGKRSSHIGAEFSDIGLPIFRDNANANNRFLLEYYRQFFAQISTLILTHSTPLAQNRNSHIFKKVKGVIRKNKQTNKFRYKNKTKKQKSTLPYIQYQFF